MSSPPPPDPYVALGVAPAADIAAIRSAHRKLVLKHHPDRIQDPALKEQGKDAFQKIQQAYELLSDPIKRTRYDDQIRLAALRKEAMTRDSPSSTRSQNYSTRSTAPRENTPREYNTEDGAFYETRRPRHEEYTSSRERFEEPNRASSRKYQDYDRTPSTKKPAEKERPEKSAKAAWSRAQNAVNFGIRLKKDAEKSRSSKTKETKERERRSERAEKEKGTRHGYHSEDSDSDTATHVTASTIKPSTSARHTPQSSTSRPSTATRRPTYGDESEESDYSRKWESSFDKSRAYIEKAAAASGKRPPFERHESGSFWSSTLRSGSDSDRHQPSSGRHSHEEESPRARPSMPTQNSAPNGLKSRVDERPVKSDRRSAASASHSPREQESYTKPSMTRSQTMPSPRTASKRDAAPKNSSNLKHTETHDSGYGSSSSPHTPDPREESPVRRTTKSRYQIVDPDSEDERATRIHRVDDESDRRRRHASPEPTSDKRRPERPRVSTTQSHVRGKSSRDSPVEPKLRRGESARDSPSDKHYSSSREKLYGEMDEPFDRESRSYKYTSGEKTNVRGPRAEAFSRYEDVRSRDFAPGSRFHPDARGSRRPSVQGF